MSSSSSFRGPNTQLRSSQEQVCKCGLRVRILTSWTRKNPGRRFIRCPISVEAGTQCPYFEWIDPELPSEWYKAMVYDMKLKASQKNCNEVEATDEEESKYDELENEIGLLQQEICSTKQQLAKNNNWMFFLVAIMGSMFCILFYVVTTME